LNGEERIRQARILIADDHDENVVLLKRILHRAGYTGVTGITDSRRITEHVRDFDCDLLLLDLRMPHLDGFAVLDQLQPGLAAGVSVVLVTGEVGDQTRQEAMSRGASDVLTKPYDLSTVLDVVERLLRARLAQ
jgi:CheY-like chemotaxis protein